MVIQGVTFMLVTLLVFSVVAWAAGTAADRLRSPRLTLWLNRASAVIFTVLAVFTLTS